MIVPVSSRIPVDFKKISVNDEAQNFNIEGHPNLKRNSDAFKKSTMSFKGECIDGKYYDSDIIADAKKYMRSGENRLSELYNKVLVNLRQNNFSSSWDVCNGFDNLVNSCETKGQKAFIRTLFGVTSFGITELNNVVDRLKNGSPEDRASQYVRDVRVVISHFKSIEQLKATETREKELAAKKAALAEQTANAARANKRALKKIEHTGSINEIHNKLKTEFCSKLTVEKTDSGIKIPHGIMLEGAWGKFADDLIKWTADNSDCRFVQVSGKDNDTLQENLWEELQKARKVFKKTKERTLISVESFDRLITKGLNSFENIEALKAEMCRFATEYGSTIIFGAKDAKKLVSEAIQPNRLIRVITKIA